MRLRWCAGRPSRGGRTSAPGPAHHRPAGPRPIAPPCSRGDRPMSAEPHPTLPPVRLPSDAELARDALGAPLFARAVRLARWAGPHTRVHTGGELAAEQLPDAAAALGLDPADEEGPVLASQAWR